MIKKLLILLCFSSAVGFAQTTIIGAANNGNFENATPGTNWTIVNPADGALWFCNTFSKCAGTNAAYIGTASGNNNYNTAPTGPTNRKAHIYRDVTFPAGETNITLTFDFKCQGESTFDGMKVFLGSTGATPVANTAFTTTDGTAVLLGSTWYNLQGTCATFTITIPAANAGTTKRLVFSWHNDGSGGTTPGATLDNVVLTSSPPTTADECATAISLTPGTSCTPTAGNTTTGFTDSNVGCTTGTEDDDIWYSFVATATSHTVTVDGGADFDAVLATYTDCTAGTLAGGAICNDATTTDGIETNVLNGLTIGNTYYVKVHDYAAGGGNFTICVTAPVTCGTPAAATLPYSETFETGTGGCPNVVQVDAGQTNEWTWGTATANGGTQSMYISNNGGTGNVYSSTTTVSHFYRDITFPASPTCYVLTFDFKGVGESGFDYLNVYLVSTATTPVAGTVLGSGQLGGNFLSQSTWTTNSILIPASNAGTTKRLVFTWRNDGGIANNPPAAIDNISITAAAAGTAACPVLSSPANGTTGICPLSLNLSWAASVTTLCTSVDGYKLYLGTNVGATNVYNGLDIGNVTTYTLTGLLSSTTYYWTIVPYSTAYGDGSGCTINNFTTGAFTADNTVPISDNFSGICTDWTIVNGAQTNKWYNGSATGNTGNSMYISNNSGVSNAYSTGSTSVVHFYKDLTFPASPTCFNLSFDFKGNGEADYDEMSVYLVSTGTTPVAGTVLGSGLIGGPYNSQTSWQTYNILIPAANAGTTMRLVFTWENDGSFGSNPPAAVDNINLTASAIGTAACPALSSPANGATGICPLTTTLSWAASVTNLCTSVDGYKLYFGTNAGATNIYNGLDIGNVTSYNLTSLSSSTTYYWTVVPYTNLYGDGSGCTIRSFTTGSFTSDNVAPISDNFSGVCADWTIVNGSETNQWYNGSATGNPGSSMYISNDLGATNTYSTGSTSVVHFYKDIDFPAGLSCITLSFDWKGVGETSLWDYISVYLAPTTETVTAGTMPTASYQIGTDYYNQSSWQTVSINIPASAAGTTKRLIFTWENDGSGGTQPPGAIDNISITATAPTTPNCAGGFSPANASTGICPVSTTITWTEPTGTCQNITGYLLYFGTDAAATNIYNGVNLGDTLSYILPTLSGNTTYYWKIVPVNAGGNAVGCTINNFTTSASPSGTACQTALGTGVTSVTLPYSLASGTTSGGVDNLTSSNAVICGSSSYYSGEDNIYVFTPTSSGALTASVTITGSTADAGLMLYEGCPLSAGGCGMAPGTCVGYSQSSNGGTRSINACVQAGVTYYLVLDAWTTPVNYNFTNLSITAPTGAVVNDDPCTAISLAVASSCSYSTYSNQCATASSGVPAPGCANYLGGDVWFKVTVPSSGTINIDTDDLVMTNGGMAVYSGSTCSALTLITCDDDASANGAMPSIFLTGLTSGSTLYIRVWEYGNNNNGTFGICVTNPCPSGSPNNDACTSATSLTLGTTIVGTNSCAGSTGEPSSPSCWTSGTMNTVWYSFVAPASGTVSIRTIAGTLTDTQIQLLSGTCGSMTSVACNEDAASCGGTTNNLSLITATGLTPGATYYIRVDGVNATTGTFGIIAVDGTVFPGSANQDCIEPGPVCNQVLTIGNPGYQSYGANCDLPTSYCLASGERNVVWYRIPILSNGTLTFNIVPNDYTGSVGAETDYDYAIWKFGGSVTCASILAGTSTPDRCNYNYLGVTGLAAGGNSPGAYPGYDAAYETPIAVTAGEVYILAISNYSNSTSGFTCDFNAGAPIDYTASPTTVAWTGGTSTAYNVTGNWGGCAIPTCGINAEVTPSSTNQPNVTSAISPQRVKDLMINPGSTLTLGPNSVLEVCGNFTNLGTFTCDPTSTVIFNGTGTQTVSGSFTGTNAFGNFTVTKTSGSVVLGSHVDVQTNFTTSSSTSVFNIAGYILTVGGNFTNSTAGTTFTGVTGSTVIFNGSAAQTYSPGGSLALNHVTMNHSGPGVTITTTGTPNMIIGTSGVLTLTNGKIITPGSQQVEVRNTANAAVSVGNTASYVEGNLRRYLAASATGSFDFPVGEATKGYQRANLNFTTAASAGASQLLARFDAWGGTWPQPGAPGWGPECAATYNQPYLDNGYWSIDVASGTSTGNYDITLYNTNYTNAAAGFSVAKSPSGAPAWALQGTCVGVCPVTAVQRTGMTGFSKFATIQSSSVLPLQLLSFNGWSKGTYNELKWETAKEENLSHFELESSFTGFDFKTILNRDAINNSSSNNVYKHNDPSYYTPFTYYRLKSVDFNGEFRYSSIIQIKNEQKQIQNLSVYPNPSSSEINIGFDAPYEDELTVEITDVLGRVVLVKTFDVTQGINEVPLTISGLMDGTYIVSCKFSTYPAINTRVVKQK